MKITMTRAECAALVKALIETERQRRFVHFEIFSNLYPPDFKRAIYNYAELTAAIGGFWFLIQNAVIVEGE